MPRRTDNLTPKGKRQRLLRELGLWGADGFLTMLREMGPEEARFIIEHEHREYVKWAEQRRDFLLEEFGTVQRPRPRGGKEPADGAVRRHGHVRPDVYGEKMA